MAKTQTVRHDRVSFTVDHDGDIYQPGYVEIRDSRNDAVEIPIAALRQFLREFDQSAGASPSGQGCD